MKSLYNSMYNLYGINLINVRFLTANCLNFPQSLPDSLYPLQIENEVEQVQQTVLVISIHDHDPIIEVSYFHSDFYSTNTNTSSRFFNCLLGCDPVRLHRQSLG